METCYKHAGLAWQILPCQFLGYAMLQATLAHQKGMQFLCPFSPTPCALPRSRAKTPEIIEKVV